MFSQLFGRVGLPPTVAPLPQIKYSQVAQMPPGYGFWVI
jgi:hypothetical protein